MRAGLCFARQDVGMIFDFETPEAPNRISFVHGASSTPLSFQTVGGTLDGAAAHWGDRDALIVRHQNVRWTYADLKSRADTLAASFISIGLVRGERIGIWAPNCSEWVAVQFAAAKAGLILVNLNPAYRISELEFALTKSGCKVLVSATRFKTSDYIAMLRELLPEAATCTAGELRAARAAPLG